MSNARLELVKIAIFYNVVVDYFGKDNPQQYLFNLF